MDGSRLSLDAVEVAASESGLRGVGLRLVSGLAGRRGSGTLFPQSKDILTERLIFEDGSVKVPDAPGLGVELDREKLPFLHRRCLDDDGSLRERDDAAAMRGAEPGWETPAVPRW
jgi:hypothetical protein